MLHSVTVCYSSYKCLGRLGDKDSKVANEYLWVNWNQMMEEPKHTLIKDERSIRTPQIELADLAGEPMVSYESSHPTNQTTGSIP